MALILEIRDAGGNATRHRLGALPLTLGRGLSNDIILDDPYLDALHARIALGPDGRIEIDDLGTVNGLVAGGSRATGPVAVEAGSEVRAGRTILRFRDADEAMPPALADATSPVARPAPAVPPLAAPGAGGTLPGWLLGTPRGRVLCVLLALCAFTVFGYVTAALATYFIGRDAEDREGEIAGAGAIEALRAEVAALAAEVRARR